MAGASVKASTAATFRAGEVEGTSPTRAPGRNALAAPSPSATVLSARSVSPRTDGSGVGRRAAAAKARSMRARSSARSRRARSSDSRVIFTSATPRAPRVGLEEALAEVVSLPDDVDEGALADEGVGDARDRRPVLALLLLLAVDRQERGLVEEDEDDLAAASPERRDRGHALAREGLLGLAVAGVVGGGEDREGRAPGTQLAGALEEEGLDRRLPVRLHPRERVEDEREVPLSRARGDEDGLLAARDDPDPVAPPEIGLGGGGRDPHRVLERRASPEPAEGTLVEVDEDRHVLRVLELELEHGELSAAGARRPVDPAQRIARAVLAHREGLGALARLAGEGRRGERPPGRSGRQIGKVHGARVDDEGGRLVERHVPEEQPQGVREPDARRADRVGAALPEAARAVASEGAGAARDEGRERSAAEDLLVGEEAVLDLGEDEGEHRAVLEPETHVHVLLLEGARRHAPRRGDAARGEPRVEREGEERRDARSSQGEESADAEPDAPDEREEDEVDEGAPGSARRVERALEVHGPGGGASAGEIGTGVFSSASSTTASDVSPERRARGSRRIRWSSTAWATAFTSSGTTKRRSDESAWACATRASQSAARALAPRSTSFRSRVASESSAT